MSARAFILLVCVCLLFFCSSAYGSQDSAISLLFSTDKGIHISNMSISKNTKQKTIELYKGNITYIAALDYHYEQQKVCWSDTENARILCAQYTLNSTSKFKLKLENKTEIVNNTIQVEGLAIDWFTNKIYWTDRHSNQIEVVEMTGDNRKVLFWTNIDQLRAIALVPMKGFMFWTDWGEFPKIERASMDGDPNTRKVIVGSSVGSDADIFWPNGLTVDYGSQHLYWSDGKLLFIKRMDFDGGNIVEVVKRASDYPQGLAFFQNTIFWIDWKIYSIFYHNINSTEEPLEINPKTQGHLTGISVFHSERQPKMSHPCENNNGGCSHLCLLSQTPPGYTCACPIGIKLLNKTTCHPGPLELVIVARRTDICLIYLDSPDHTFKILPLSDVKYSIAVDFDPVDHYIYWSDDEMKKIQKARLDGSDQQDVITTDIQHPDGIAVDWISRNIYWTDAGTDRIEVARLENGYRKVVIGDGLVDPRGIAVAPEIGWLFWSDWKEEKPKIERSNLDGSERIKLVYAKLGWPNGVTLDTKNKKLYWCDAKLDKIEYANMDGSDRKTIIKENVPHVFGIGLMGDNIYWTDWQRRAIDRANKNTGIDREIIHDEMANIMGLKAVRMDKQIGTNPCSYNNGNCSQLCFHRYNKPRICACQIDYELKSDGSTCVKPNVFLLYTKKDSIGRIGIENKNNEVTIPISNIKHATAIDFDPNTLRMYWSDSKSRSIMRAFMNGTDPHKVIDLGLRGPEGIAVDWLGLNIYWTDPLAHKIEVARLVGSSRRTLLWDEANEPRSIVLDPEGGYMYWSEWGNPNTIKKSFMDGTNVFVLINMTGRVTGLSLDYDKRRLYWSQIDPDEIWSADFEGKDKKLVLKKSNDGVGRPVSLSVYNDHIYWSDEDSRDVIRVNKIDGSGYTKVHSLAENITDILVYHSGKQKHTNQCATSNGGCSHLCLALPMINEKDVGYTCACPTHYSLQNGTECKAPSHFMLYSLKNLVVRLLPDTTDCPEAVLPIPWLKGVKAIDFDPETNFLYWINNKSHTIKRSETSGQSSSVFIENNNSNISPFDIAIDAIGRLLFWTCSNQDIINVTYLDKDANTQFGSLEPREGEKPRLIAIHVRKRLLFYTDVGNTPQLLRVRLDGTHRIVITMASDIIEAIAVDMDNDAILWSQGRSIYISNIDGENKHVLLNESTSIITKLTVHSGWLYWIDKNSNELQRLELKTGKSKSTFPVQTSHIVDLISVKKPDKSNPCNTNQKRCSHFCIMNGSTPVCACPKGNALQEDKQTCKTTKNCRKEHFSCSATSQSINDCIPIGWRCDGQKDCSDGSDELNCPSCQENEFRCKDGQCINKQSVCDSTPDCRDKSDELDCCENSFQCSQTSVCISMALVCDGYESCADGSDEKDCNKVKSNQKSTSTLILALVGTMFVFLLFSIVFYSQRKKFMPSEGEEVMEPPEDSLSPLHPNGHHKNLKLRKGIPDVVRMSMVNDSCPSTYDRSRHITGASSSSNTNGSSSGCYPRETLNPPPSPATTAASTRASSPTSRYRPYRHYRAINQPPPPTPCSTDVCDESDYNYYGGSRNRYDGGPFPPPPTPRSHCHQESCPPSPSSRSSTYFSPLPPPPSPVQSPRGDSDS